MIPLPTALSCLGKTLVAKAVARECGLPFLSIKGPELLGSYVGESEANIRAVFGAARSAAVSAAKPHALDSHSGFESGQRYGGASVLFFDELDSLAPRRGETGHGDGVMERVVATLLGELDSGMEGGDNTADSSNSNSPAPHVIVIGATNRPDLLDPSLLRPGRFDRLLYLGPAKTQEACLQILLAQTRKLKFQDGIDRSEVLSEAMKSFPPTLSGADLSAVASGALMRALKRVCDLVEEEARRINSINGADGKSVDAVDINDVMESWTDEQLQPTVLVEDFVHAAKDIVPSISEDDLKRFEMLRDQFSVAW
jgi:peroxin-6